MDNGILAAGAQDIDFMIHGLFSYKIFGHEVWITTSHVCILIIMLILIAFSFIVKYKMKAATEVPGGFQNVVELMVEKLDGVVDGVMGKNAPKLVNYISTIFIFILMSNISGLFGLRPVSYTHLDVYKRQGEAHEKVVMDISEEIAKFKVD